MTHGSNTAGLGIAPDERDAPAPDPTQLRLAVAAEALSCLYKLACAVEKTTRAAIRLEQEDESDDARGLFDCVSVVQNLMIYIAARSGDVVRDLPPSDVGYTGDTAGWVMPQDLDLLLRKCERRTAQ
jgi:hypothetical protein